MTTVIGKCHVIILNILLCMKRRNMNEMKVMTRGRTSFFVKYSRIRL